MKSNISLPLLLAVLPFLTDCSTAKNAATAAPPSPAPLAAAAAPKAKSSKTAANVDEVDEYADAAPKVLDPIEPLNRGIFWVNDKLYTFVFKPISKSYQFVFPKPVRKGIDNAFENVKYPVRLVNCTLQGKFKRAGQETGKFFVNTIGGVGGIFQPAEKIPALAQVPSEDTGQTLATWGIPHGPYIVLPLLGPSSVRETVGLAGDYAANPVNWPYLYWNTGDWNIVPPASNTLRSLPDQLDKYDAATRDTVDPYLAARSAFVQNRADAAKK